MQVLDVLHDGVLSARWLVRLLVWRCLWDQLSIIMTFSFAELQEPHSQDSVDSTLKALTLSLAILSQKCCKGKFAVRLASLKTPTSHRCKLHHPSHTGLFYRSPLCLAVLRCSSIFHNALVDTKCVAIAVHFSVLCLIGFLSMNIVSKALQMLLNVCLPARAGLFWTVIG